MIALADLEPRLPQPAASTDGYDLPAIERAVRDLLVAVGEDPDRDGLIDTPARVARAYVELFRGLHESPVPHLARVFEMDPAHCAGPEPIVVRDIEFHSLCEHHLLPFTGRAHVAYVPSADGRIVGLSKIARTVDVFARRPQVQERLTNQIADAIDEHLQPKAVAVAIEAEHFCMKMRGACQPSSVMVTTALRGAYRDDRAAAAEVTSLLFMNRRH